MRAMILAAGRGERMRPLTDNCPKPMLRAGGRPLIVWHLERLAAAGIRNVVINHAWLGAQIEQGLGSGAHWGISIRYSAESTALETAGGIAQALPWLGNDPFLVVNGDIWCDWDVRRVSGIAAQMQSLSWDAWCVLVDNPPHHPAGDFVLRDGRLQTASADGVSRTHEQLTFAGIGIYRPALFHSIAAGTRAPLAPLLRAAAAARRAGAERHVGHWTDVGTPQRLAELDAQLKPRGLAIDRPGTADA